MQSRITKLHECPDCRTATDGKSCRCGWENKKYKQRQAKRNRGCNWNLNCGKPIFKDGYCKKHYEDTRERTPEEKEKSKVALKKMIIELINKHPEMFVGKKWNEYRKPKQKEKEAGDE